MLGAINGRRQRAGGRRRPLMDDGGGADFHLKMINHLRSALAND